MCLWWSQYVVVGQLRPAVLPDVGAVFSGHTSCTKPVQNQKNAGGCGLDKGYRFYTMATLRFFGIIRLKPLGISRESSVVRSWNL
jgi:hypothetical protein